MATSRMVLAPNCSIQKRPIMVPHKFKKHSMAAGLSSVFEPILGSLPQMPLQIDASKTVTKIRTKFLDAFVDSVFEFVVDKPLLPSQSNFAPVEEIGQAMAISNIQGEIPENFPEGVYIRNGGISTRSILGRTTNAWVEGEGMLHALYFKKQSDDETCTLLYNNRYVETLSYKLGKQSNKPLFLPGSRRFNWRFIFSSAEQGRHHFLSSNLNYSKQLRFGENNKHYGNTNVFEHSGKFYLIADNHIPQEIDIFTLSTLNYWDINGNWKRPFNSHPKKVPGTGELFIFGVDATKPFLEVGIVSADGKELVHRADIKLDRCSFCHEMGVTGSYIAILDFRLTIDLNGLHRRGPLIKYEKEEYARIGIMPLYGDADSIKWFEVEPNCTLHIINSFEDGHEVVLWGCRALDAIIPGREHGNMNDTKWFSRCNEWRLNMETGEVKERYLTRPDQFMDFPVINGSFTGIKNKYGYTQVVDPVACFAADAPKFGALAKLYFGEQCSSQGDTEQEEPIRLEYHKFEGNTFCTGIAFVPKEGALEEDGGWIVTFAHNEDTGISQVHMIDAKKFSGEAVAKITLPCRVPYGFLGAFMPLSF